MHLREATVQKIPEFYETRPKPALGRLGLGGLSGGYTSGLSLYLVSSLSDLSANMSLTGALNEPLAKISLKGDPVQPVRKNVSHGGP